MAKINWDATSVADTKTILKISKRAKKLGHPSDLTSINMDISAVHMTTPLKLGKLLKADDFNFMHDVMGINRHLDRDTGELGGCFRPRFAQ